MIVVVFLAILGFLISTYTFHVERRLKATPSFKPFCDISDHVSCTKPMQSQYANIFFVSNATAGIVFYLIILGLAMLSFSKLVFWGACVSVLMSIGLAYILYMKVRSFCILCSSLYLINILLFFAAWYGL